MKKFLRNELLISFLALAVLVPIPGRGQSIHVDASPSGKSATAARLPAKDEVLQWEAVVDATLDDVWDAWTTKKGMQSWMAAVAEIELKVGGVMMTSYSANVRIGDDATIVQSILSFEPKRMISFRLIKAPADARFAQITENAWYVLYLSSVDEKHTQVRLASMGWGEGPEWDKAREFFKAGNAFVMKKLQAHFVAKPASEEK